jgi:hypothetical protein
MTVGPKGALPPIPFQDDNYALEVKKKQAEDGGYNIMFLLNQRLSQLVSDIKSGSKKPPSSIATVAEEDG